MWIELLVMNSEFDDRVSDCLSKPGRSTIQGRCRAERTLRQCGEIASVYSARSIRGLAEFEKSSVSRVSLVSNCVSTNGGVE